MKTPHSKWWETASHDEINHHQSKRLNRFLRDRVLPFSAHYRRLFRKHGLEAQDIKSTEDLVHLPFTSKRDLGQTRDFVLIPDEGVLKKQPSTLLKTLRHGPGGAKELLGKEFRPILMTSTTGRSSSPVPFLYSQHDLDLLAVAGTRMMELCQCDPSFRHLNVFPFAPHLAFWLAHYAGIGFNTFMISTGGGKVMGTSGNADLITKINPDSIIGMPTFLYHLAQRASSKNHRWTELKRIVLGGEKVPPGMRRKLQSLCADLGAQQVDIISTYGFTEAKMAWSECLAPQGEAPSGFHIYPDFAFLEIVDPETGERVPEGQPGEIVFTPLDCRGSTVLRYRTGDLIDGGLTYEPCPHCGRTCPRLRGNITRVSDRRRLNLGKVKGTLVDFGALEHVLDDTEGLGAWQLEIRKTNNDPLETDEIVVHAVSMNGEPSDELAGRIREHLAAATELCPNEVQFHSWAEMRELQGVGTELKECKLVDHRPEATTPTANV